MPGKTSYLSVLLLRWVEPELAKATRLVREVTAQLDRAMRENIRLADERDDQRKEEAQLRAENTKLQHEVHRLVEANRQQASLVADLKKRLDALDEKYTYMMGRVMQLQAEQGKPIEVPKRP